MDELVERCKVAADKAEVEWTLRPARERMREDLIEGIIRAIIPIVADWQRERDAAPRKQDWQALATQIRLAMAEDNLSYRDAAELIGTDQATLHRLAKHGREPSGSTLMLVLGWLERRTATAIRGADK